MYCEMKKKKKKKNCLSFGHNHIALNVWAWPQLVHIYGQDMGKMNRIFPSPYYIEHPIFEAVLLVVGYERRL